VVVAPVWRELVKTQRNADVPARAVERYTAFSVADVVLLPVITVTFAQGLHVVPVSVLFCHW